MFERVTIRASDLAVSQTFYRTVLPTVGLERFEQFTLAQAGDDAPATRRLHIAFAAPSRAAVDEFWRVGTAAGYQDDGAPGPRPQYGPAYYGGFLLDPDGNSAEAVHNEDSAAPGQIDHLWIRVTALAAARAFYEQLGFRASWTNDDPPRVGFKDEAGSFSLVQDGPPTQNAAIAFAADGSAIRDADGNVLIAPRAPA